MTKKKEKKSQWLCFYVVSLWRRDVCRLALVIFTLGVGWQVSGAEDLLAVPGVDTPASTPLAVQGRLALQPNKPNASVSGAGRESRRRTAMDGSE